MHAVIINRDVRSEKRSDNRKADWFTMEKDNNNCLAGIYGWCFLILPDSVFLYVS